MDARGLAAYATATGRFLVEEHGFRRTQRRFVRTDDLMRSVWFIPLGATPQRYTFDVVFDLGIPGISEFGSRAQTWVIRADAKLTEDATFVLDAGDDGRPVAPGVEPVVHRLTGEFLLRYAKPDDLYTLVRDSALAFPAQRMQLRDEFARLRLDPWNDIVRLEIAAVYAAFLGHDDDLGRILDLARDFAPRNGLANFLPRIDGSVAAAQRAAGR